MLVLSRKIGEQIIIPELNITVTVLSAGPNRVQLGINAPKEIDITRPGAQHRKRAFGGPRDDSVCDHDDQLMAASHVYRSNENAVTTSFELSMQ